MRGAAEAASTLIPQELMAKLARMSLMTHHRVRGTMQGKRRSGQLGSSLEFADYRPYSPGDDMRRLDWHAYAKTGRPYVKLYLDEQELQVSIYIDASASMDFPPAGAGLSIGKTNGRYPEASIQQASKFLYAKQLAACVGYAALCSYDRVGVQMFGESVTARLPMRRGQASVFSLLEFLGKTATEPKGDVASVFMKPASLPARPGMAWVFSDFLFPSGVEESIKALLSARQEVRVVQILSPQEMEPELSGDLRLVDCETGEGKEVAVSGVVLKEYKEAVKGYTRGLEAFCKERGVGYYLAVTSSALEETVLNGFRRSGLFLG